MILLWCATGAKGDLFSIEWNFICQRPKAGSFSFFFVCARVWVYNSVGGKILTNDNLRKREIALVNWYFFFVGVVGNP